MVALTQRDLPYLVLTEDPYLQAYRTDRVEPTSSALPGRDGDLICQQVSYEPMLTIAPGRAARRRRRRRRPRGGFIAIVVAVVGRDRRSAFGCSPARAAAGREREPLELET